jgi:hypothetical protein
MLATILIAFQTFERQYIVASALITPSLKNLYFGTRGGTIVIEVGGHYGMGQVSPIIGWK